MAYHLTSSEAYRAALYCELMPVKGGFTITAKRTTTLEDRTGAKFDLKPGQTFLITGTKDSNGYVITVNGPHHIQTYLVTADVGAPLFKWYES